MVVTVVVTADEPVHGRHAREPATGLNPKPQRRRWLLPTVLIVGWLAVGGVLGTLGGKLNGVLEGGTATYLPTEAESKEVLALAQRFGTADATPAVIVYVRDGGLTDADGQTISADFREIERRVGDRLVGRPQEPIPSRDGAALQIVVQIAGTETDEVAPTVAELRAVLGHRDGLRGYVTGEAGLKTDLGDALGGVDLMLVGVTAGVILVILVTVYRSPLLPFLVLAVAGTALGVTQGVLYLLVEAGVLELGSEVLGILNVLVLGAATDYALLLVARYREALRRRVTRYDAMHEAWRSSFPPVVASAGTVALGLLCLLASDLGLNRDLGPVGAIGVVCSLAAMLTFLPAVLVLLGRTAFWPYQPAYGSEPVERSGRWARVADRVGRRPRPLWIGTAVVLAVLSLGVFRLDASGVPVSEQIRTHDPDSKVGGQVLRTHFPGGGGNPAVVITRAEALGPVLTAATKVEGVALAVPYTGPSGPRPPGTPLRPVVAGGLAEALVTLEAAPDTIEAEQTVRRLRDAVHAVSGADAKVGGYTAVLLDFNDIAERDRRVMPLLLGVIFVVLAVLLRALVAPVLAIATVVLSYLAALGVSGLVFTDLFGFPGSDSTFPLHTFVFLVALGVDYNIFLMTRVREEAAQHGTRRGMLLGLAVTGGVITSAGVVLAATFSALALIPLLLLVELAFTVAFGVLLDTFVVRSLLLPALTLDVGRRIWWPSALARRQSANRAEPGSGQGEIRIGRDPDKRSG